MRIINVIRDLYFTGGNRSFANRFRTEFPVHQGSDGMVLREVPIPMVALVATAVSVMYNILQVYDFMLMCVTSFMRRSRSGVPEYRRVSNFQQMRILTCIKAMLTRLTTFVTNGRVRFTQ